MNFEQSAEKTKLKDQLISLVKPINWLEMFMLIIKSSAGYYQFLQYVLHANNAFYINKRQLFSIKNKHELILKKSIFIN